MLQIAEALEAHRAGRPVTAQCPTCGHVLTVTLNRPEAKNAFSGEMLVLAHEAWKRLDEDPDLRVGILTGAGGDFCSGMDLKALAGGMDESMQSKFAEDPDLHERFLAATGAAVAAYSELLEGLEKRFADVPNATLRRKQARQAARAVLPNATETRIVVTGNYRAWRHFVAMRASEHADVEIRELAIACLRELQRVAGNVFGDFRISALADGTEVAASPLVTEG